MTAASQAVLKAQANVNLIQQQEVVNALIAKINQLKYEYDESEKSRQSVDKVLRNSSGYSDAYYKSSQRRYDVEIAKQDRINNELPKAQAALRIEQAKLEVFRAQYNQYQ